MMATLHDMHDKNSRKKSVAEGQKILILKGGVVIGRRINVSSGGKRIFGGMNKCIIAV